jgi:CHAD domain-containing protein
MQDNRKKIRYNLALAFNNLIKEVSGVRANKDIEFLHRMRVASRRLNNILWAYRCFFNREEIKKMRREIKKITRLLGRARDLDTQVFFAQKTAGHIKDAMLAESFKAFIAMIAQKRVYVQEDVLRALSIAWHLKSAAVFAEPVVCREKDVYEAACENINRRLKQFLKLSRAARYENSQNALHKMRIGAKHLRYTLENFSFLDKKKIDCFVEEARLIQQTLGDMHNHNVWRKEALVVAQRNSRAKEAGFYLADLCRTNAAERYQEFLKVYHRQHEDKIWSRLKQLIVDLN